MSSIPIMSFQTYSDYFDATLEFLSDYNWVCDLKLTKFIEERAWERIPSEWLRDLKCLSNEELNHFPYATSIKDEWGYSLKYFVKQSVKCSLPREQISKTDVAIPKHLQSGMSPKKTHEVSVLSKILSEICHRTDCSLVLDIGSGLGYVGLVLRDVYNINVLGVESEETRSHGFSTNTNNNSAKLTTIHLTLNTSDTSIENLLQKIPSDAGRICIVGLHCCGNLTPTMLKLYHNIEPIRALVCVSCCYHMMQIDQSNLSTEFSVFPMSSCLKGLTETKWRSWKLSSYAMRLAAQETKSRWRIQTEQGHLFHRRNVFYRGIVESYTRQNNLELRKIKQLRIKPQDVDNFTTYLDVFRYHYSLRSPQNDEIEWDKYHINQLLLLHESLIEDGSVERAVEIFTGLQVCLQGVIESLITIDRCCYLSENSQKTNVVPIFNDVISPRNLAIISEKD